MGDIKKAIISIICIVIFIVLWRTHVIENRYILVGVGIIFGLIAYKLWDS